MRRIVVAAALAAGLTGCTREAPSQAEVEACLRDTGAEVQRPPAAEQAGGVIPEGARYVTRAFYGEDKGAAQVFSARDERTAEVTQERLRDALAGSSTPPDAVKRDATWVVLTEATEREAKAAFACIR
jgi:hypothetical protein